MDKTAIKWLTPEPRSGVTRKQNQAGLYHTIVKH